MPRTLKVLARWLLVVGLVGCAGTRQKPTTPSFKPVEEGDKEPTLPPAPAAPSAGGGSQAPVGGTPAGQDPAMDPQAPVQATPDGEIECRNKKECKKLKGKPGKGMTWTCVEGVCMAEGKVKKKKRRR